MATEDEVRQASGRFYAAINAFVGGDLSPMRAVWTHTADVTTLHPIAGRQVGWDEVWAGWEQASTAFSAGQVQLKDQLLRVGSELAYEIGVEDGSATMGGEQVSFTQRVTNIYRRAGGEWKIVHHHSDVSPTLLDALSRLQPPS